MTQTNPEVHKSPEGARSGERYYISSKITSKLEDLKKTNTLASNDEYSQATGTLNTQESLVDKRAEGLASRSQKRSAHG